MLAARFDAAAGAVTLTWQSTHHGRARILRGALAAAGRLVQVAEVPAGQTEYVDRAAPAGSLVYRVEADGENLPLAAKLELGRVARLLPVALAVTPATVATLLSGWTSHGEVRDAATHALLADGDAVRPGMVLEVKGAPATPLTVAGTLPDVAEVRLAAGAGNLFAVPLTAQPLSAAALGLSGLGSVAKVYSDGNQQPITSAARWRAGDIVALGLDRDTEVDLVGGRSRQGAAPAAPAARPFAAVVPLVGTPDDGTKVAVLYDASYQTLRYKCWANGKSGAWDGITDGAPGAEDVKNAGVVRRGRTLFVTDDAGISASTKVTVWGPNRPGQARPQLAWSTVYDAQRKAAAIMVPVDAPVGDYQVQLGDTRGNYATVYIIFDPAPLKAKYGFTDLEWRSWVYDDVDWQTVDDAHDHLNHVFEGPGYPLDSSDGVNVTGFRGDTRAESGANGGIFGQRWVEVAMSIHGDGTATPLEAVLHGYEVIGQRFVWTFTPWNGFYANGSVNNTFDKLLVGNITDTSGTLHSATELDVVTAEKAALGLGWSDRYPPAYIVNAGQCFNLGTNLAALYRAMGIPGRAQHTLAGAGWPSSYHVWAEACLDTPVIHPQQPGWWKGCWYKTDGNDPHATTESGVTAHEEGNITPAVIAGFGEYLLNEYKSCQGIGYGGSFYNDYRKCAQATGYPGTHAAVVVKNASAAAESASGDPLLVDYTDANSAWGLVNLMVPAGGPASPSGQSYVLDGHHGYVLNEKMYKDQGVGFIDDNNAENDVPELIEGAPQRGIAAGWGYMIYRIPVGGRAQTTVKLTDGADKVELLGALDKSFYSAGGRWEVKYDAKSDANGVLSMPTTGGAQLYVMAQLKGLSNDQPGVTTTACCGDTANYSKGQEVGWFTLLLGTNRCENANCPAHYPCAPLTGKCTWDTTCSSDDLCVKEVGVGATCLSGHCQAAAMCVPPCGANELCQNAICVCQPGYVRVSGRCVPAPPADMSGGGGGVDLGAGGAGGEGGTGGDSGGGGTGGDSGSGGGAGRGDTGGASGAGGDPMPPPGSGGRGCAVGGGDVSPAAGLLLLFGCWLAARTRRRALAR